MCLVLAFSNAKKLDVKKVANVVGPIMLHNEPDGFGYSVQGRNGQYGERFIGKNFRSRLTSINAIVPIPVTKKEWDIFGEITAPNGPAIFHGRTSTNDGGLLNCHPMARDGWTLIHNGVVTDHGPKYSKLTTNDSEDVLYRLIEGMDSIEKHLTGYYAFASIDPSGQLHIGRDDRASLYIGWSKTYETYIIGTTYELVAEVSKKLELKIGPIDAVKDNVYWVMDGNAVTYQRSIQPRGFGAREARHSMASLGIDLGKTPAATVVDATKSTVREAWPTVDTDEKWTEYELYRQELEEMDASYEIYDSYGRPLTVHEFHKLDGVSQELCCIIRPDGTTIDLETDYKIDAADIEEMERLHG